MTAIVLIILVIIILFIIWYYECKENIVIKEESKWDKYDKIINYYLIENDNKSIK